MFLHKSIFIFLVLCFYVEIISKVRSWDTCDDSGTCIISYSSTNDIECTVLITEAVMVHFYLKPRTQETYDVVDPTHAINPDTSYQVQQHLVVHQQQLNVLDYSVVLMLIIY